MIAPLYVWTLTAGDFLFGWLLLLPGGLLLPAIACLTSFGMVALRRFSTDQELLACCHHDKRILRVALRQDKAAGDRDALLRHREMWNVISLKQLRAEVKPLLLALPLLAVLAAWCCERIAFVPPVPGGEVTVSLRRPISAAERLAHLVPQPGVHAADGWIRSFMPDARDSRASVATWRITADGSAEYALQFRVDGETYTHRLAVGRQFYTPPEQASPDTLLISRVTLEPRRLFGLPGIPALGLQPWMLSYLLLTFPLVWLTKKLTRTA